MTIQQSNYHYIFYIINSISRDMFSINISIILNINFINYWWRSIEEKKKEKKKEEKRKKERKGIFCSRKKATNVAA